ncbi:MAG: hypothetical protein QM628_16425 [Propionicimonas sp.]
MQRTIRRSLAMAVGAVVAGTTMCNTSGMAQAAPRESGSVFAVPGTPTRAKIRLETTRGLITQEGSQPIAPTAFDVIGDAVFLDDPVSDSITKYVSDKAVLDRPVAGLGAVDFVVDGQSLVVLGEANQVYQLADGATRAASKAPTLMATVDVPQRASKSGEPDYMAPPVYANRLDESNGSINVLLDNNTHVALDKASRSQAAAETYEITSNGFVVKDAKGTVIKRIAVPHDPSGISEIHRADGYVYYLASDSHHDASVGGDVYTKYVLKFTDANELVDTYTLRRADHFVPNREVVVDGHKVYQLHIGGDAVRVLELSPDKPVTAEQEAQLTSQRDEVPTTDVAPMYVSASNAMTRGVRMANLEWTYSSSKNGDKTVIPSSLRSSVKQPSFLVGVTGTKTFRGYPYNWGGYDSEWTASSSGWTSFANGLSKSKYAGNITNAGKGYITNTIGLDCSGYVSAAYDLGKKYGTVNLIDGKVFKKSTSKPVAGDIYNKSGSHVVIVMDRRKENGTWVIVAGESTTAKFPAGDDKVLHHVRNESSFDNAYVTGKYLK